MEVFQDYAYYYNAFYHDKDYAGEAKTVNDLLVKYSLGEKADKILNIGCGTGRHDLELAKLGYDVYGIDISKDMISIAEENYARCVKEKSIDKKLVYSVQDARNFHVEEKFDVTLSLFHVMSYQNTNEDINSAVCRVGQALQQGGIFLFDVWYGPGVLTDRPAVRVKRIENEKYAFTRIAEPVMRANENIVEVHYEVYVFDKETQVTRQISEVHNMRYFFKPEIEEILKNNGFQLMDCLSCDTLQEPDFNSWTVYFIARKEA